MKDMLIGMSLPAAGFLLVLLGGCAASSSDYVSCTEASNTGVCMRYEPQCKAWVRKANTYTFTCEK